MKIERLSDNQVRFTVWSKDLPDEDFSIADLAGKTEKAEELIRYMMTKAHEELGFIVEEKPIIVEAMPVNKDCIVFLITRVDETSDEDRASHIQMLKDQAIEMARALRSGEIDTSDDSDSEEEPASAPKPQDKTGKPLPFMIYTTKDIENFITVASMVRSFYDSDNTLYRKNDGSDYYLLVSHNRNSDREFQMLCDTLREFTEPYRFTYTTKFYFEEHYKKIIKDTALQVLSDI